VGLEVFPVCDKLVTAKSGAESGELNLAKAYLVKLETEGFEGKRWEITSKPLVIGRNKEADVMILSRQVSRLHCVISLNQNGEFTIADMLSHNGTKVNGQKVQEVVLQPWDRIAIGDVNFIFKAL
jgi:pSer/pThr/pTyr-binding forkhead associated (FHA) protein